jgi:hypothetical protein
MEMGIRLAGLEGISLFGQSGFMDSEFLKGNREIKVDLLRPMNYNMLTGDVPFLFLQASSR